MNSKAVNNFSYLGETISYDENIEIHITVAKGVVSSYNLVRSNNVSRSAKMRPYKTIIRPIIKQEKEKKTRITLFKRCKISTIN